jgi:hypothetical protein
MPHPVCRQFSCGAILVLSWTSIPASVAFYLDDQLGELLRTIEQKLVGCLCWYPDQITRGYLLADSAFNGKHERRFVQRTGGRYRDSSARFCSPKCEEPVTRFPFADGQAYACIHNFTPDHLLFMGSVLSFLLDPAKVPIGCAAYFVLR